MHRYAIIIYLILIIFIVLKTDSHFFILQNESTVASKNVLSDTELRRLIEQKAEEYDQVAENAYIDRVWKKTPGRNGVKINIEKSFAKMKKSGAYDETSLVKEQIPPEISLEDLPAAPIYRGHPEKKMVALLINVSWGTEHVPNILKTLKENGVKATFFIEGKWAKQHSDLVKMIVEQHHEIGNHAYNHPDMARMSNEEIVEQITKTNHVIEAIIGYQPKWFAPPSGSYNERVVEAAHQHNMETILWTVDTVDWKNPSVSVMINRVITNVHPGATILMHPTPAVERGLVPMIQGIQEKGYSFGTIEQLLNEER